MTAMCYTCRVQPAGNDYAGPYSAYCGTCQPRDTRSQPRGSQCGCPACGRIFATLTDFDGHQERYPRGHDLEGVFTGRCLDPAALGLDEGMPAFRWETGPDGSPVQCASREPVWGTPAGNAQRRRFGEQAAARAADRKRQPCLRPANGVGSISQVPPALCAGLSVDTEPRQPKRPEAAAVP